MNEPNGTQLPALLSISEARRAGLKRYFTGEPCSKGHVAERWTYNSSCVECSRERAARHATVRRDLVYARGSRYRQSNLPKFAAKSRKWRAANPAKTKQTHRRGALRRMYGIDQEQYDHMFKEQDGKCAICGAEEWRALAVDHNHRTNRVRALLCHVCNKGLGVYEKNAEAFAAYLLRHEVMS